MRITAAVVSPSSTLDMDDGVARTAAIFAASRAVDSALASKPRSVGDAAAAVQSSMAARIAQARQQRQLEREAEKVARAKSMVAAKAASPGMATPFMRSVEAPVNEEGNAVHALGAHQSSTVAESSAAAPPTPSTSGVDSDARVDAPLPEGSQPLAPA